MVQLPMLRSRGSFRLLKKSPEGVAFSRKKKVEKNKQLKRISIKLRPQERNWSRFDTDKANNRSFFPSTIDRGSEI